MKILLSLLGGMALIAPSLGNLTTSPKIEEQIKKAEQKELWNEHFFKDQRANWGWASWGKTTRMDRVLEQKISYYSLNVKDREELWEKYLFISFKTHLYASSEDENGWGDHSYNKNKEKTNEATLVANIHDDQQVTYEKHVSNLWTKSSQSKHREVSVTLTIQCQNDQLSLKVLIHGAVWSRSASKAHLAMGDYQTFAEIY